MNATTVTSFAELKNLQISTVAEPKPRAPSVAPRKPKHHAPKKVEKAAAPAPAPQAQPQRQPRQAAPQQPAKLVKPVYSPAESPSDTFGKLVTILDGVFGARNLPNTAALADYAMCCFAAAAVRRSNDQSFERAMLSTLEGVVHEVAAMGNGNLVGTRCRRLLHMLGETPAIDENGNLVRIGTRRGEDELVIVERAKEASSALDVWKKYSEINEALMGDLETAKVTKRDSLRVERLKVIRRTIPDLGSALVVAAIMAAGFNGAGMPKLSVDRLPVAIISWCINTMKDLREILAEDDEVLRGQIYIGFLGEENNVTAEEYSELVEGLERISVRDSATQAARNQARSAYEADKAVYDGMKAEWKAIQGEIDGIQQEAVNAVDLALALFRHKLKEKEYFRAVSAERKGEPVRTPAEPKVLQPQAKKPRQSEVTPNQAVQALVASHTVVDVDISVPQFNGAALGLSEVERRKTLAAAGLDGGRECVAYPGVVWEAVMGPLDHAMDLERNERDCRMVVIAPRRVGGMGLDLADARALLVEEYESYFTPIEE